MKFFAVDHVTVEMEKQRNKLLFGESDRNVITLEIATVCSNFVQPTSQYARVIH